MRRILLSLIALIFLFVGCSQKEYFKPKKIDKSLSYKLELQTDIRSVNRDGLTYSDGSVITDKRGMLAYKIPANFHLLYDAKNAILIADGSGEVQIVQDGKSLYKSRFDTAVVSGAIKGSLLAVVLANNRVILVDTKRDKRVFDEELEPTFAQDARIANPLFVKNLVLFPTLDGRLLVIDLSSYSIMKDIALSDRELFNNIIYLQEKNGVIVAATRYKIVSVTNNSLTQKQIDLKDIAFDGRYIYIFANDGRVIKSDIYLKTKKELKFNFANFVAVTLYDKLYAVLKNGYVLALDKDLNTYKVYQLPSSIDAPAFAFKNRLFIGKYFIILK